LGENLSTNFRNSQKIKIMIPNAIGKVQFFSQVTKTSAICKHYIHWEISIEDVESFACFRGFLQEEDFDFRLDAFSSYNGHSVGTTCANNRELHRSSSRNKF
jgi:hypothetical protein